MDWLIYIVIIAVSSLMWRIRGGLEIIPDKKLPLNKWWFCTWYACAYCILNGWNLKMWLLMFIATKIAHGCVGWGKYLGALCGGSFDKNEVECYAIDKILNELHIGNWYLIDHAKLYGFCGTTLRGGLLSFIIGLAMQSLGYLPWGLGMGVCYWLGTQANKVIDLGKGGWNWGEWIFGAFLGLGLCVFG